MAIADQTDTAPEMPSGEAPAGPDTSLLGFLRDRHAEIAREHTEPLTLAIAGDWKGALGIRYEYPDEGADAILKAQSKMVSGGQVRLTVDSSLDIILAAAKEIMGRRPGEDWSRPLGEERPLVFGPQLADMLGVDLENVGGKSRFLCRHLFSPKAQETGVFRGDLVLTEQAGEVMNWLRQADSSAGEEFSGE